MDWKWLIYYVLFTEYRFATKARLNLLPVCTVLKRTNQLRGSIHCRHCRSQLETLVHALNHCRSYMSLIQSRHGDTIMRLQRAVPKELGKVFLEQEIPGDPKRNCPDIVVINQGTDWISVVDMTIPFEGEDGSLLLT